MTKEDGLFGDPLGVPLIQNRVYRLYIAPGALADRYIQPPVTHETSMHVIQ